MIMGDFFPEPQSQFSILVSHFDPNYQGGVCMRGQDLPHYQASLCLCSEGWKDGEKWRRPSLIHCVSGHEVDLGEVEWADI